MVKGKISNELCKMRLIDFRLLLKITKTEEEYMNLLPEELDITYDTVVKKIMPFIPRASLFLDINSMYRLVYFTIGYTRCSRAISYRLGDYIAESYDFETRDDFNMWYRPRKDIKAIYTKDPALVSLDPRVINTLKRS